MKEKFNYMKTIPFRGEYDVLVVGAGPAGVCAAVSAARQGARVLLCERYGTVGGMMTSGHVCPLLGAVSSGTMYDEVVRRLRESDGGTETVHTTHNGKEIPLDKENAKIVLDRMIAESGVTLWLGAALADAIVTGGKVTGAIFATQNGLCAVSARVCIDATGDGCLAAAAGADYKVGRDGDGALQPMTLEFSVSGVDEWVAVSAWGGSDPVKIPCGEFEGMEYRELCRMKNEEGELPENVTIVRLHRTSRPGERSVNATQANGYDPLDPGSLALAELDLREQIADCLSFLHNYVPGYENAVLTGSADTVGVRESRRITGLECVRDENVELGLRSEEAVVHNAWFLIDIHNPRGGGQAEGHAQPAEPYDIPYGALVPAGIGGLLTAGRCISGSHRAHASYRVMAICMAAGEAAGIAAAICAAEGIPTSELPPARVRDVLKARGVEL